MSLFPIFLKLDGRSCLVVGAGKVGAPKIQSLLDAHARVVAVAPRALQSVQDLAASEKIIWKRREFEAGDLQDIFLVIAATASSEVNRSVFLEAQRRNILCNCVDDPQHCDFYYPAVVRRGDLQLAISTAGKSPALAQRLRVELEEQFGTDYAAWVNELGNIRERLFASDIEPEQRRRLLHEMASREAFLKSLTNEEIAHVGGGA